MTTEMKISYFAGENDLSIFVKGISLLTTGIVTIVGRRIYLQAQKILFESAPSEARQFRMSGESQSEIEVDTSLFLGVDEFLSMLERLEKENKVSIVVTPSKTGTKHCALLTISGSTHAFRSKVIVELVKEEVQSVKEAQMQQRPSVIVWPATWSLTAVREAEGQLVTLAQDSEEWRFCFTKFHERTGSNIFTITEVQRVENERLWGHYSLHKTTIQNEKWLFHGTPQGTAPAISAHGFNRSYAGKHATYFGEGSYFSVDSFYASYFSCEAGGRLRNATDTYCMFLNQVLVGDFTEGASSMKAPPQKTEGQTGAESRYDSAVDNIGAPSIFVVFKDFQAYPTYLISFKLRSVDAA
ncbi:hypothetical protein KFL_001920010 [Klebsormidium nitens]|uniref:Poly [ADP-ribose] polymerase n=1 Tax=Klebsormidium nitens TaxID=105231 RepID=A0A1Y1I0N3_KLENI|nr:hypothetical protein KFL_001920010 [Klebsormidium nitens]|eukprot:GAQ84500.1 hypothetical protein KFL_001920010 [Klebsormidium nitens]